MADAKSGKKPQKLKARLPRGLADRGPAEIAATRMMVETIRQTFERYGFDPVGRRTSNIPTRWANSCSTRTVRTKACSRSRTTTSQWISLRYDLTAPLARFVATRRRRPGPKASRPCARPARLPAAGARGVGSWRPPGPAAAAGPGSRRAGRRRRLRIPGAERHACRPSATPRWRGPPGRRSTSRGRCRWRRRPAARRARCAESRSRTCRPSCRQG